MAGSSPIFQPIVSGGPVATLLLIENSREMSQCWPELRAHYLPTLLGTMRLANPIVPIQVLLLPTSPASTSGDKYRAGQMEYNEQLELGFNFDPQNRIMPSTVQRAIHSLASTFEGTASTRHLFIIAASDAAIGADIGLISTVHTGAEWQGLSNQLIQQNIHLHMILRADHKMERLIDFFYRTLEAQGKVEATPWFKTDDRKYRLLLSTERKFPLSYADMQRMMQVPTAETISYSAPLSSAPPSTVPPSNTTSPTSPFSDPEIYPSQPVRQPPLLRSQTFPPPAAQLAAQIPSRMSPTALPPATVPPTATTTKPEQQNESPKASLVTRIKKIHGMTKRRTYGTNANLRPPLTRSELSSGASTSGGSTSPTTPRGPLPYHRSAAARAQHLSSVEGPAPLGPKRKSRAQALLDTKAGQMPAFPEDGSGVPLSSPISESIPSSPTSSRLDTMPTLSALTSETDSGMSLGYPIQQQTYYYPPDMSAGNTTYPGTMQTYWYGGDGATYAQPAFSEPLYGLSDPYPGQQCKTEESWQGDALATRETSQSLNTASIPVTAADPNEMAPLPISGMPLATSTPSGIPSQPHPSLASSFARTGTSASAPTSPVVGGDQPFIFDPEYEMEVAARYEETIRAAGISPPVIQGHVSAHTQRHPYTAVPIPAQVPSRPPLYISTQSSPTNSGPSSLQGSPLVPSVMHGQGVQGSYATCSPPLPLQQGPPLANETRYFAPPGPPPLQRYGTYA